MSIGPLPLREQLEEAVLRIRSTSTLQLRSYPMSIGPLPLREQLEEAVLRIRAVFDDYDPELQPMINDRMTLERHLRDLERERQAAKPR